MEAGPIWLVVGWVLLHVAAMTAACGTRIAAGSNLEFFVQLCFFVAMAVVGAAAWLCHQVDGAWCWSAITLVAMVLTAVIDLRRFSEPAAAT
jgi:hypothetical protein